MSWFQRPPAEPGALPQSTAKGKAAAIAILLPALMAFEGIEHTAVHERADPPGVITVCNGITNYDLPKLKRGDKYTDKQCAELLRTHLMKYFEGSDRCIKVPMGTRRTAAFLDFSYNEGNGNLCKSRMVKLLNEGKVAEACAAFTEGHHYDIANHKHLPGLQKRRAWEGKQCLRED